MEYLGTTILAIGALGTASFGIVEGFKWTRIGLLGFNQISKLLGAAVMSALKVAYGDGYLSLLQAQYRANRTAGELPKSIRQGARIGLTPETSKDLATSIGVVGGAELTGVATKLRAGKELTENQRNVLGRYELALDTRIDAALALANERYAGLIRCVASFVSLVIAIGVAITTDVDLLLAVIVGIAAVPIAPVAKDLTKAIQSAGKALSIRK